MKLDIGGKYEDAGSRATLDVPVFLRTRMLVQAASGQGKSHWLRRLCEQLFGKVQIFVIDVEGEFSTLRPKFDFAVVGEGGDAPADVRSAALLAQKLLELRTSAIFDLSEAFRKHPRDRHTWVKNFLGSMMEAPKRLWHPVVVVVDEAHKFAPEKDESEASDAMIALTTDGRKRQFCAVYATQRLGKLSKDAAAELLNVMIGGTVLDIDRKRAAEALGVYGKDLQPFNAEIKTIERGFFWCLGPAIARDRLLTHVGPTVTSSPKFGSKASAEPPPPTAKIKALLPQLADLPKLAVEKQQTEAELRKKILDLERAARSPAIERTISKGKAAAPAKPIAIKPEQLITAYHPVELAIVKSIEPYLDDVSKHVEKLRIALGKLNVDRRLFTNVAAVLNKSAGPAQRTIGNASGTLSGEGKPGAHPATKTFLGSAPQTTWKPSTSLRPGDKVLHRGRVDTVESVDGVTRPQTRILAALAQLEAIDQVVVTRGQLAFFAGTRQTSSSFEKNVGTLRTSEYVTYPQPNTVTLTDLGRAIAPPARALDPESIKSLAGEILTNPERNLFEKIHEDFPNDALTREELAERAGVAATSSSFEKNLGNLKTAGLITYPVKGSVRAAEWLFF